MKKVNWLRVAQIAWVILVASALVMFAAGAVIQYGALRQVCTALPEQCAEHEYATPPAAAQLNAAGISLDTYALLIVGIPILFALLPIGLGVLIFVRKHDEFIGLLVSFFLVSFGMNGGPLAVLSEAFPPFDAPVMLISYTSTISLPLFFGLFPNGRMVPRVYWLVVILFGTMYISGDILQADSLTDPFWYMFAFVSWLSVLVGGTAAQVYRYLRVATFEEKKQTRWVLFGLGLLVLWIVGLLAYTAVLGDPTVGTTRDPDIVRRIMFLFLLNIGFEFVFLAIGMAILRSRLFDIDVIIRRTVTYATVVALLLVVYFGSVILLQQLFANITGQRSELITIISTLAIAALFVPLRNRIQDAIDKRFNRRKYNAQQVLQEFGETVRDETDLDKLTAELVNVVQETMQPKSVSVWLKKEESKRGK